MKHRHVDEDRYTPGFARKISREDRRLPTQPRRCLRARARQRAQLSARRPDQLLYYRRWKKTSRLRKRQTRFKLRSAKPRRKYRLLHRQARRLDEEIWRTRCCYFQREPGESGILEEIRLDEQLLWPAAGLVPELWGNRSGCLSFGRRRVCPT